jgi:hypothetical protein
MFSVRKLTPDVYKMLHSDDADLMMNFRKKLLAAHA